MTAPAPLRLVTNGDLKERLVAEFDRTIAPNHLDSMQFVPSREQPCAVMRARGVYVSDVLHNGLPVVYSVDSKHDVLQWVPWYEGHLLETIQRDLWTYLNAVDPIGSPAPSALPPSLL